MKNNRVTFGRLLAAAGLFLSLAVGPAALAQSVDLHGWLGTQYRFRDTEGEQDQDLYQYLSLSLNNSKAPLSGFVYGRLAYDLDFNDDNDDFSRFASIYDTYDSPLVGHLYYAYLDLNQVPGMKKIRMGRMGIYDAPVLVYIDGLLLETNETKKGGLSAGAYVGSPVHFFETDTQEDLSYGAWLQARPWSGARLRADYAHVDDQNFYGDMEDDFIAVNAWQQLGEYARVHALYSMLEDEGRDLQFDAVYFNPKADFMVSASYYELLETQKVHTIDFDPFYAALFEYQPYWQGRVLLSKGIGENFFVEGGLDTRQLKDEDNVSNFNHEFDRYFGTIGMRDLPEGLTATVSGEMWDSNEQLEQIQSVSGDLTYRAGKKFRLSLGTYYSLYKYDYYFDKEQEKVQTYYARVRYAPTDALGMDLGYEVENGEYYDFQTMKLGFRYSF